ncbi:MAG: carbohydrate porin [Verrucomicrobia bacterium]|nr:carbohydrate porin [Verrucomicrobiota bacterium]
MTTPVSKTAASRAITAVALLATPLIAGDACSQSGCCEKKDSSAEFGVTGDWFGVRSTLKENGYELTGSYIAETFGNPRGGQKRGMVFDGLLKLTLDVNLEKAVSWPDATFRMSGLYPHGTSGTQRNVGDASVFSNIDAYDTFRLVDFWVEQKLLKGKVGVKAGQMKIDDEFGVTDSAAFLVNATFGVPQAPYTPMPLATYPVGGLGIRLRVEPLEGLYGMAGVYDGNPSPGDLANPVTGTTGNASRHGTDWALRDSEGALYIGEIGFQRSGAYPGALRVGLMRHTGDFPDIPGAGTHSHTSSSYYVIDQTIWQKAKDSKEGVSVFLRGTMAPESSSFMSNTTQVGVVYTGLAKTDDKVGVAYARNKFSPGQRDADSGRLKDHEAVTELSYQVPVTSYLKVQPDMQYISHPGGTTKNNNAWVLGVRAILEF